MFWTQFLSQICVLQIFSLICDLSFLCLNNGFHRAILYLVKPSSSIFPLMDHDIDVVSKRCGGHLHSTRLLHPTFPHIRTKITGPAEPCEGHGAQIQAHCPLRGALGSSPCSAEVPCLLPPSKVPAGWTPSITASQLQGTHVQTCEG